MEQFFQLLREDKDLYEAYKANIAMSFFDAFKNSDQKYRVSNKNVRKISNEAADIFLSNLISEDSDADGEVNSVQFTESVEN